MKKKVLYVGTLAMALGLLVGCGGEVEDPIEDPAVEDPVLDDELNDGEDNFE